MLLLAGAAPPPTAAQPTGPAPDVAATLLAVAPPRAPYCSGEYADDFAALNAKAREFERDSGAYTFCIRTTATYECPWYGPDGTLRKTRKKASAHGTGFAYKRQNGETLLLTNDHVAEWPAVTDAEHPVDDVPAGCKRVSDSLSVVDSEDDAYEHDDIPLTRVVADPQLDVAILASKSELPVMPWRIGRSAGLRERNVVDVRGFPLGVFKATNVGKVISPYNHDDEGEWDHDDFVVDALLSPGNSGSPVFAISCKTGEFELVGVYHARYSDGSALNVVISIDQLRDIMTTLKRAPRPHSETSVAMDAETRARILAAAKAHADPFFPFGSLTAEVRARDDGTLVYAVLDRDFPFRVFPILVLEDLPTAEPQAFGSLGHAYVGGRRGLKAYARADLDADAQAQLSKILDGLRRASATAFRLRDADAEKSLTHEGYQRIQKLEKALHRIGSTLQDLSQGAVELVERLRPDAGDPVTTLAAILSAPPPAGGHPAEPAPPVSAPSASAAPQLSAAPGSAAPSP